jgi:hypothetical protein
VLSIKATDGSQSLTPAIVSAGRKAKIASMSGSSAQKAKFVAIKSPPVSCRSRPAVS